MYNSNCDNTNGGFFVSPKGPQNILTTNQVVFKAPVLGYPPRVVADRGPQVREFCVMTARDGLPCKKCGTSEWDRWSHCVRCGKESDAKYRRENSDKAAESATRWRLANREAGRKRSRDWRRNNTERARENERRWQAENPGKRAAKNHRYKAKKRGSGGSYTAAEFRELCNHYGNRCLRCGRCDLPLTVDHVVPLDLGGTSDISNLQPLCQPCNSSKNNKHIDYRPDAGVFRWIQAKLFG